MPPSTAPRFLIATDEAGYGPRLGPLVIFASTWEIRGEPLDDALQFAAYGRGLTIGASGPAVLLGDSKQLFRRSELDPLSRLEMPLWLLRFAEAAAPPRTLDQLLGQCSPCDLRLLQRQPWFRNLADEPFPLSDPRERCSAEDLGAFRDELCRLPQLIDLRACVLDARQFNDGCRLAGNKATLLSERTLALVAAALRQLPKHRMSTALSRTSSRPIRVVCDRHGGRRRYAGLIQQMLGSDLPIVLEETAGCSRYRVVLAEGPVELEFRVSGDRFPPVALASMAAKYVRERLMGCFNRFWQQHAGDQLRPTAGYTTDAKRFLSDLGDVAARMGVDANQLVRDR
jgi:ribonuclease HII